MPATDATELVLVVVLAPEPALLGRRYPLDPAAAITLGRDPASTLALQSKGLSRAHARLERRPEGWWVLDAGSTNGTFVNGAQIQAAPLRRGDTLQCGDVILKLLRADEARGIVETEYVPTRVDGLTGTSNRRHLCEQIERALQPVADRPPALLLLNLDRFKRINDEHGHLVGDRVLQEVARRLRLHTRPDDLLARHAGDVFAVLLPGTDLETARARAEALRAAIASPPVTVDAHTIVLTASVGVAQADRDTRDPDDLVCAAHQQLLAARR